MLECIGCSIHSGEATDSNSFCAPACCAPEEEGSCGDPPAPETEAQRWTVFLSAGRKALRPSSPRKNLLDTEHLRKEGGKEYKMSFNGANQSHRGDATYQAPLAALPRSGGEGQGGRCGAAGMPVPHRDALVLGPGPRTSQHSTLRGRSHLWELAHKMGLRSLCLVSCKEAAGEEIPERKPLCL